MRAAKQSHPKPRRSRGRPKREDAAGIESKLLAVAFREFVKHGYGASSMRQIAKVAEISKTTLYAKYPSKEHLFRAIMQAQLQRVAEGMPLRPQPGLPDIASGLKAYANHMLDISFQGDLLKVNRLIFSEAHRFPELGAASTERTGLGIKQVSDFIRTCAASDGLPCRNAEAVAEIFILMIRGWYVNIMLTNRKVSAAQREHWVDRSVEALLSDRSDW